MDQTMLRSAQGRKASALDFVQGRISLVAFFYASCSGICPQLTANMKRLSAEIQDQSDLQFLSITIDPTQDDEAALLRFRARHKIAQSNWLFLTGGSPEIARLAREQFAGEIEAKSGRDGLMAFAHTENIYLIDREGYLRGIYRARGTGEFPRIQQELLQLRKAR